MNGSKASYASLPDSVLAGLVKDGDERAFTELYARYIGIIGCIAMKFSAEGYEHNDFLQEGLLGLLNACRSYSADGGASFKSYLSLVVERRFIGIIRRSNTKRKIPRSNLVPLEDIDEAVEDSALNPEEQVAYKEQLSSLTKAIEKKLSEIEFNVLMLYGSGYGYKQIAAALCVSEKSVDNALQRARKKISALNVS